MNIKTLFTTAQTVAVVGLLFCGNVVAQESNNASTAKAAPVAKKVVVSDVSLDERNVLVGQYLQSNGKPYADSTVALVQNGKIVQLAKTEKNGQFTVRAKAGLYEIKTQKTSAVCRLWAHRTAPPAAKKGVVLVADENVVRGQLGNMGVGEAAILGAAAGGGIIAGAAAGALGSGS